LEATPLDSWVSKEYLAQLLTRQELALDHLNAIRLLKALVAAGAKTRAPMASAWVDKIAVRNMSLYGTALASAVACAEREPLARRQPKKARLDLPHSYG